MSLYNKIADSTTRLTVGALLRRLGVALDKCAENHELDADKRAYLQTELMAHTYVAHIEALEERALVKKRRKEGPAPKRKRMPGRRFPVGAEGQGPPCVWGASGPKKTQDQDQGRPDHRKRGPGLAHARPFCNNKPNRHMHPIGALLGGLKGALKWSLSGFPKRAERAPSQKA